jgi:hypothetical protein
MILAMGSLTLVAWATGDLEWQQVPSYTPDPTAVGLKPLTAISFSSSSNGNAVGHYTDDETSNFWVTVAQHWDGTSWEYVPTYNHPDTHNFLYGVSTISSTEGWAVGSYEDNGHQRASVLHFSSSGDSWVNYPITVTGSTDSVLTSVTSNSTSDVWAVGYYIPTGGSIERTLTMHYDGTSWSVVSSANATSPLGATVRNQLYGVTNVPGSSNLFWAVGVYDDGSGNLKTLTLKGDTNSVSPPIWTVVSSVNGTTSSNCLRSVSAGNSTHVWAVGFQNNSAACLDSPFDDPTGTGTSVLIERWDGSAWTKEDAPDLTSPSLLYGVSVASDTLVWAVGYHDPETIVLGRDSSGAWTRRQSENPSTIDWNRLLAVDALSQSVAWAAGWYNLSPGYDKPTLIEHYVPPTPTP